ncbi:hemerythrin domain-containing protein [Sulfurirhabdus autotrophica]|uniref:Hemerythrin HHE cation binding domain-containing protein n=1 Tax=Sulfurirhabdus autotrophica TaxID=1706046 RepID=A0A4R3XZH7_9PROT|nr:hemerythrin domain-containing protein [Sulfurirhabdus autotrophica]TCV83264.1 hemerythrin HHE cation binding domain-containing protein [Sulfurirhabdus autotrophica]
MSMISTYLTSDHHRCDELFAQAEESVAKGDWLKANANFAQFLAAMRHHFGMEEEIAFPAFEQATGVNNGPTWMMRMEHEQMREVFDSMNNAIAAKNAIDYLGQSETLLIVMQQHNMKEEQMLYPMSDQVLGTGRDDVVRRMQAFDKSGA